SGRRSSLRLFTDAFFICKRMIGIGKGQGQRVEEDCRRLFKGYTVLPEVGFCLRRIPLIDHSSVYPSFPPRMASKRRTRTPAAAGWAKLCRPAKRDSIVVGSGATD